MNPARVLVFLMMLLTALSLIMAAPGVADTFRVEGEITDPVMPGQYVMYYINLTHCEQPFAGYDILLQYNPATLTFSEAVMGGLLISSDCEYFNYRMDFGKVRLVALADATKDSDSQKYIFGTGTLAELRFFVATSEEALGTNPVRFYWDDCGDNVISSVSGDTLFVSNDVYDYDGTLITGTPNIGGIDPGCFGSTLSMTVCPPGGMLPAIDFVHGAVVVDSQNDYYGCDPNGNYIAWEIADLTYLTNYIFLGGVEPVPLMGGDCNCDGNLNILDITRFIDFTLRGGEDPCGIEIE